MTSSLGTTPTAKVYEVEELVALVRAGEIRIPEFQRPFRWGIEDARRLFDSILRGYPLGSLLLWERPAEPARIRVGALHIDAPALDRALWVVDGQQRVTTLANALSAEASSDDRFSLSFNLSTQQFVPGVTDQRASVVPLPVLFDLQNLMQWFRDRPEAMDHFDAATNAAKKIRQFKIPASVVETQDESVLRDIFDRLNSYGKRLTRAEVFSALHPVTDGSSRTSTSVIEEIAAYLAEDLEFGDVDGDTILRAVLARRGPDITREIRGEFDDRRGASEFPGEDADTAYHEAQNALELAVRFLQRSADVPHFAFLPYRHLLIVLARFFAHHPAPNERETQLLRRWFWRAAAAGPEIFPGSTTGTARALCSRVIPDNLDKTLQGLLGAVPRDRVGYPDVQHFRTNHATGKMIACSMWALHPRSLRSGELLERSTLIDVLGDAQTPRPAMTAIVPRRGLPSENADTAARWLLAPGLEAAPSEVLGMLRSAPPDLPQELWEATCESHGIAPWATTALAEGDMTRFINIRDESLRIALKAFMDSRWEYGFEDTPPLDHYVLDDLELEE
ncbi:DUF262 domain-containing protein [[Mycobacterium] fortunisiensis]|uniref:DUF262 domain-containing protein n=1 Tax=[Mycobacterium] fortunisiensis TaxID=2600579 RepID=UPI001C2665B6|nr:DUF262 domain-containing protein [[Mycobacterium] fortunisiensis]